MTAHTHFTVSATSYLRNLDEEDRRSPCFAVHHQDAPRDVGNGCQSISLRFPVLVVTEYVTDPEPFAKKVAHILERHWDDAPDATTQSYDAELLTALVAAVAVIESSGLVWMGAENARAAIAKARGRSPQPAANCAAAAEAE